VIPVDEDGIGTDVAGVLGELDPVEDFNGDLVLERLTEVDAKRLG
jgi:hypothetical protein